MSEPAVAGSSELGQTGGGLEPPSGFGPGRVCDVVGAGVVQRTEGVGAAAISVGAVLSSCHR